MTDPDRNLLTPQLTRFQPKRKTPMHRPLTPGLTSRATALASTLATAGLLAAGTAQAQSSVQLYGLVDLSVGQFQTAGSAKVKRLDSGNLSTSYFGLKGTEDLGGGLQAGFTLDSFLLADSGGAGRVPGVDAFWSRNANLSLSGGFGMLRLGRMATPMFVSSLLFNSYGESFGYSPTIRQYYNSPHGTSLVGDSGWNNAIGYTTPRKGGLTANLLVAAGEGAATARGPNVGANLLYFAGPLALTVALQKVEAQGTLGRPISAFPGFSSQSALQFGASYDLNFVKFSAQYGSIETRATQEVQTRTLNLSASLPMGRGDILAAYGSSESTTAGVAGKPESEMLTLGYNYRLSKRTDIYGLYMSDKYTGKSSGTTLAAGVRHSF
ncbi:MAG: porin [Leptothrix sp. (in: Bacteria)]|nr:porin [Leptothrix sp. (in: b-proteobacteria)]